MLLFANPPQCFRPVLQMAVEAPLHGILSLDDDPMINNSAQRASLCRNNTDNAQKLPQRAMNALQVTVSMHTDSLTAAAYGWLALTASSTWLFLIQ